MPQGYKGLKVWNKSYELTLKIYKNTKLFPNEEIYGLVRSISINVKGSQLS